MRGRRARDWIAALVLAAALVAIVVWLPGEEAEGLATAIDGDSLRIGAREVRLLGIDAPEGPQTCQRHDGRDWPCGRAARALLDDLVSGQPVTCTGSEEDRYGRLLARCRAGGLDLGAEMVRRGMALASRRHTTTYERDEVEARSAGRGIWSGRFVTPWDWREGRRR